MNIRLQISDEVYKKLVASGNRVRGSIALVSPSEGNFNAWRTNIRQHQNKMVFKTAHSRTTIDDENVRVSFLVNRHEMDVDPAYVVYCESEDAGDFIHKNIIK